MALFKINFNYILYTGKGGIIMDRIEIELNCKDYLNMNIPFDQLEEPDPWDGKEIELYHKRVVAEIERGNEPFENEEEEFNDDFYSDEDDERSYEYDYCNDGGPEVREFMKSLEGKSTKELKEILSKLWEE